jgi:heme exporter protein A
VELKAEGIIKRFGEKEVLKDLSLTVQEGEVYVLVGPNGSGKTTLMSILASVMRPDSGHVQLGGENVIVDRAGYRRRVGFLSHAPMLYSNLTARENLSFLGCLYGVEGLASRVEMMLEQVGLESDGDEVVRNFSRGMVQRLSIARAFLHNPQILLLDEPYSGLDQAAVHMLTAILRKFSLHKRIVILTSHNLEAGMDVATRGGILFGRQICHESSEKLDKAFVEKYLSLIQGKGSVTG